MCGGAGELIMNEQHRVSQRGETDLISCARRSASAGATYTRGERLLNIYLCGLYCRAAAGERWAKARGARRRLAVAQKIRPNGNAIWFVCMGARSRLFRLVWCDCLQMPSQKALGWFTLRWLRKQRERGIQSTSARMQANLKWNLRLTIANNSSMRSMVWSAYYKNLNRLKFYPLVKYWIAFHIKGNYYFGNILIKIVPMSWKIYFQNRNHLYFMV
jgi:hypothetical protein